MKKLNYILLILLLTSCYSQKNQKASKENLRIIDIGTSQLSILNKFKNSNLLERNQVLLDSIYKPNKKFWNGYLGDEEVFLDWINEKGINQIDSWNKSSQIINPDLLTSKLNETAIAMYKFTGHFAKGEWNILYGPAWADLGGFDDGTMLIDLAHKSNKNAERIIRLYPHELNHQIYSNTLKTQGNTVLHRIIDEGFATYVSYLYHRKKYSIAQELMYSEEDYRFCTENENELLSLLKENYYKEDESLSRKFADRGYKFKENYPDAIGYYLGFRIIEEFIKQNGKDSWRKIYVMEPLEVLNKSKILK
ncbi:uncharacterized protein YjaZ [Sphingobacterium alimentarium]|uniref:Uncharacterized protein YjaZ n=1 Tax=Sphingobacterium alimentarium TaxID=797292 RepID=A0A4R3VUP3_9SPHI|nr:DUF2268 domain-containing putative Zn-dependent protease [Sphingobacterium alimentarium]TCV18654.1 uncharacterized protein YjaZ [Sphingobacterium alimentarium]